ncbi:MAG: hypothetical protein U1B94_04070, partial [candidate division NC10 bacterium]|nr:hypothetical protein [candidate division NC10 bacterium]
GYVYRGTRVPALTGPYVFGDYCSGRIWGLQKAADGRGNVRELDDTHLRISSFGEDEAGEVYVVDHRGSIFRIREAAGAPPRAPRR